MAAMKRTPLLVALCVGGTVAVGLLAAAVRAPAPAAPTRTATIDLQKVVDKLQEKADWEIRLRTLEARIVEEVNVRKKKLEDDVAAARVVTDPAEKLKALEALQLQKLELEQWATMKQAELDRESSLMWRQIYRSIRTEAAKLAELEGYDYVMVAEPGDELVITRESRIPLTTQALEQIGRRRTVYASPAHDISEKLVLRINNARATGAAPKTP